MHVFYIHGLLSLTPKHKTVEIKAERTAIIKVCSKAVSIVVSDISPKYQSAEKPSNTHTLEEELKEKTIITASGAYKKNNISAM